MDIELDALEEARAELGTKGIRDTVNAALKRVGREAALRRGAKRIRAGGLDLVSPSELEELRRPRG